MDPHNSAQQATDAQQAHNRAVTRTTEALRRAESNLAMNRRWYAQDSSSFGVAVVSAAQGQVNRTRKALADAQQARDAQQGLTE